MDHRAPAGTAATVPAAPASIEWRAWTAALRAVGIDADRVCGIDIGPSSITLIVWSAYPDPNRPDTRARDSVTIPLTRTPRSGAHTGETRAIPAPPAVPPPTTPFDALLEHP